MDSNIAATQETLEKLRSVRHELLRLHKILMEYQRDLWERRGGRLNNSYELLKLVMDDGQFAWLHRLSELVVYIDELFDGDETPTEKEVNSLLDQARVLVTPAEAGDEFQTKYFDALQQSPDVVLAHSEVVKLLGKKPEPPLVGPS